MKLKSLSILFVIIFCSCLSEKEKNDTLKIKRTEVEKIASELQYGFVNDNIIAINSIYDADALAKRFIRSTSKKRILEFNNSFYIGFIRQFNFGEILIQEKSNGAKYDFLRIYQDTLKDYHIIFRFFSKNGINYHDHLVKKIKDEPKIADTYIYTSGESLSDTYRTIYKKALYGGNFLTGDFTSSLFMRDMKKLEKIRTLNKNGNFEKSNKIYQTISSSSKNEKIFKLTNITTTANLSNKMFVKAVKDYESKYPNDPSLYLLSIDRFILKKDFQKAIEAIDKLDKHVKGDSFLNFMRANIYTYQNRYQDAVQTLKIVTADYPEFLEAYDGLLAIYIETDQKEEAIKILDTFVTKFNVNKKELSLSIKGSFPKFTTTKEFVIWNKKNPS